MSDAAEVNVEKLSIEDAGQEEAQVSKTVLESTDFSVVHPLTHKWTLWYLKPAQGTVENWSELQKELATVSTVEEFWGALNSVPKVTELPMRADFAFFREGIRPEWEDKANQDGGKWIAQLRHTEEIDSIWLNVLLTLIGGTLDSQDPEKEVVNGVFVMVRPRGTVRVQLWVKADAQKSMEVAQRLKNVLNMSNSQKIEFQSLENKGGLSLKIEL